MKGARGGWRWAEGTMHGAIRTAPPAGRIRGIGGIAPDVQESSRDCPAYRFRCSFASGAGFGLVVLSWSAHLFATSEKPMFAGVLVVLRGGVACLQSRGLCCEAQ